MALRDNGEPESPGRSAAQDEAPAAGAVARLVDWSGIGRPLDTGPSAEPQEQWRSSTNVVQGYDGSGLFAEADAALITASGPDNSLVQRLATEDGEPQWAHSAAGAIVDLVASDDTVLFVWYADSEPAGIVALNAKNGDQIWERPGTAYLQTVVDAAVVVSREGGLEFWSLDDGSPIWAAEGESYVDGDQVITVDENGELRLRALATGEGLASFPVDADYLRCAGDGLAVVGTGDSHWVVGLDDGKKRFDLPAAARFSSGDCAIADGVLMASDNTSTSAYDLDDGGTELWSRAGDGSLLEIGDRRLVLLRDRKEASGPYSVVGLRSNDEVLSGQTDAPVSLSASSLISIEGGDVNAYSLESGKPQWTVTIGDDLFEPVAQVAGDALVIFDGDAGEEPEESLQYLR